MKNNIHKEHHNKRVKFKEVEQTEVSRHPFKGTKTARSEALLRHNKQQQPQNKESEREKERGRENTRESRREEGGGIRVNVGGLAGKSSPEKKETRREREKGKNKEKGEKKKQQLSTAGIYIAEEAGRGSQCVYLSP